MERKGARKRTVFAVGPDNVLCVELLALMPLFIALTDGLTLRCFPGESVPYLDIDTAITWAKQELEHDFANLSVKLTVLERAKAQFATGQMVESNTATA